MRNTENDIKLLDDIFELVEYDWGEESIEQVKDLFEFIKELLKKL